LDLEKGANDYLYSFQIIALAAYSQAKCGEVPARADYHREHSSVGYLTAIINSFQEIMVLLEFILAQVGYKNYLFK
jgi:hypothetical protein